MQEGKSSCKKHIWTSTLVSSLEEYRVYPAVSEDFKLFDPNSAHFTLAPGRSSTEMQLKQLFPI